MQRAIQQQATFRHVQIQATRVLPGHGTGLESRAVNDESYEEKRSLESENRKHESYITGNLRLLRSL